GVAEASHFCVPLPGKLVSLDIIAIRAARVVAEVFAIPEFLDVAGLAERKEIVILLLRGCVLEDFGDLLGGAQRSKPKPATVGAFATHNPGVIGLTGKAVVLGNAG